MNHLPRQVGPYELEAAVGSGGMGQVFAARHRVLGRRVAIKLRVRGSEGRGEALLAERFRQGAVLQGRLEHPNVAHIFDYMESTQLQAIVMELLEGGSIEDRLRARGGALGVAEAVEIAMRAAEALAYAHARGVVHRDIKPGNLMLVDAADPGSVRVTDFGVAKAVENGPDLTVAGANVGTLWYMPPEQFNHDTPTPLADVYALGATLYEMLTGQIPFREPNTAEVFRRFLDGIPPPPLRDRNPAVPPAVAAVVEQALALETAERVPSADALAALLDAALERSGGGGRALLPRQRAELARIQAGRGAVVVLPAHIRAELAAGLDVLEGRLTPPDALLATQNIPKVTVPVLASDIVDRTTAVVLVTPVPEAPRPPPPPTPRVLPVTIDEDDEDDEDHTVVMDFPPREPDE